MRMETALNNYNRYYVLYFKQFQKTIFNAWVFLINSEIPLGLITSLISYNSEGDSCSLNLYYAW